MAADTARSLLIRNARLVPVGVDRHGRTPDRATVPRHPVDVRIRDGVVHEVGAHLAARGEREHQADERFLIPGLWDQHVHWEQWAETLTRVDVSGAGSAADVVALMAAAIAALPDDDAAGLGFGYRSALWSEPATVAQLDAVSGRHPVVVVSGDAHNGWLNSRALGLLGLPPREEVMVERPWFDTLARLNELPGAETQAGLERARADAARRGVVGITDFEFNSPFRVWPERVAGGTVSLRVRASTYPDRLDEAIALGLRTGDILDELGLVTMGPLKVITDGSLNTRTAWCLEAYPDPAGLVYPYGVVNVPPDELDDLLGRATTAGIEVAVHAIGDAAVRAALDSFAATGARGSIEHAQLIAYDDIPRMADLGVTASMQPAHLLDDRDVTMRIWPDRHHRCFLTHALVAEGVPVAFGSDAPVSRLDPWLQMAAAVFRGSDEREQWHAAEALTPAQALACSTDGQGTVAPGSRGDVVLLDDDPTEARGDARESAAMLREMRVAMTVVDGRVVHLAL